MESSAFQYSMYVGGIYLVNSTFEQSYLYILYTFAVNSFCQESIYLLRYISSNKFQFVQYTYTRNSTGGGRVKKSFHLCAAQLIILYHLRYYQIIKLSK